MRLAIAELRAHLGRFVATVLGLALLFTVVLAMGGIHRGMVVDALALVDAAGDSLWLVEEGRHGPFAEASRVDATLAERARIVPGARARGHPGAQGHRPRRRRWRAGRHARHAHLGRA